MAMAMKVWMTKAALAAICMTMASGMALATELKDFAGDWFGSGITESVGEPLPGVAERELDLKISLPPGGKGGFFMLTFWQDAGVAVSEKTPLKSRGFAFQPVAGRAGLWQGQEQCMPMAGQPCVFARLAGQSLVMTSFELSPNGQAEQQTFVRTLTANGMSYSYTRTVDGWPVRRVSGLLNRRN